MEQLRATDPTEVGGCRLLGRLGEGGMGTVFLGVQEDGRRVAVKVIRHELASDPTFRVRLAREAAAAARVSGRYTARVLRADANADPPFIVSEYIDGLTLTAYVGDHGPLAGASLLALAAGLAEALTAVHAAGVVHRDLKPTNVIMTIGGPRVLDFGIAAGLDQTALTASGLRVGSPGWMAPERFSGAPDNIAGDIFGWGLLVAYAAARCHPYGSGPAEALAYRIVHEQPQLPALPGSLATLVARALDKQPSRRPTAAELVAQLVGTHDSPAVAKEAPTLLRTSATAVLPTAAAVSARPVRRTARRGAFASAAVTLAVAAATVGWLGLRHPTGATPAANASSPATHVTTSAPPIATTRPTRSASSNPSGSTVAPVETSDSPSPTAVLTIAPVTVAGVYTNGRFGFSVRVPDGFSAGDPPENGGGLAFTSPDGLAVMTVYGSNNVLGDTAHSITNVTSAQLSNGGGHVTYEHAKGDISAVSGTQVVNGVAMVVYQRTVVEAGSENTILWTYPVANKGRFDPLLDASVASFRPGDVTSTW